MCCCLLWKTEWTLTLTFTCGSLKTLCFFPCRHPPALQPGKMRRGFVSAVLLMKPPCDITSHSSNTTLSSNPFKYLTFLAAWHIVRVFSEKLILLLLPPSHSVIQHCLVRIGTIIFIYFSQQAAELKGTTVSNNPWGFLESSSDSRQLLLWRTRHFVLRSGEEVAISDFKRKKHMRHCQRETPSKRQHKQLSGEFGASSDLRHSLLSAAC